ncbi:MAG: nucleoside hydrolase [Sulfolobaceae archaeon]
MNRPVIIDSDTATDDTIAIFLASRLFRLLGITIVAGNVPYEFELRNALFTVEYFNIKTEVYPGARRPILGKWRYATEVHGDDGLSGWEVTPKISYTNKYAPKAIIDLSREYSGSLEILAISPLTNLALAFLEDPEIVDRIKRVWIMGGALYRGNVEFISEYNFWVDPEAANIVISAGFNTVIVPWEVAEKYAVITIDDWERIKKLETKASKFFINANKRLLEYSVKVQGANGSIHPDSLTVIIAAFPDIIKRSVKRKVVIETCGIGRGGMFINWYEASNQNLEIVLDVDGNKFKELIFEYLSSY